MNRIRTLWLLLTLLMVACDSPSTRDTVYTYPAGDAQRGALAVRRYGCGSCHTISGIPGARGMVGPRLDQIAQRMYIAGVLANTPENLVTWIRFPKHVDPKTAMPELGVTERDAEDIASFLYTLE